MKLNIGTRRTKDGYVLEQLNPYLGEEETFIPEEEKEYTIVGIMKRPNYTVEKWTAPGYTVLTGMGELQNDDKVDVYTSSPIRRRVLKITYR